MSEWQSADGRFGASLNDQVVSQLQQYCARAHPEETGGVLIGRYDESHRIALIVEATLPPPDSSFGRFRFVRGIAGLAEQFKRLWMRTPRHYYLGEWHYHPGSSTTPSSQDRKQMQAIAVDADYGCPEPILVIVGCIDSGFQLHVEVVLGDNTAVNLTVIE